MGWRVGGLAAAMLLAGCEGVPDGGKCSSDDDCASHDCDANVCNGSSCVESPTECEPGWSCVDMGRDPLFGIPHAACVMHCVGGDGCPAQYGCSNGFCNYVGPLLRIVAPAEMPRAREPFVVTAVLTPEPTGTTYQWTYDFTTVPQGSTIELSLEPGSHNIVVTASFGTDIEDTRRADRKVDVCPLAGDPCGTEFHLPCCAGLTCDVSARVCR